MFQWVQAIDDAVFQFVQVRLQQPMLQYVARDITSLGGDTLVALFTIFVTGALWLTGTKARAAWFLGTMLVTAALIVSLKLLIGRPCPIQPDPYQHRLIVGGDFPTGLFSLHLPCMPSGHTMGSTVLYGSLMFLVRDLLPSNNNRPRYDPFCTWATAWLIALPIAIGVTRIILSAHWTTDVLVGYGLAWVILLSSRWIYGRVTVWSRNP